MGQGKLGYIQIFQTAALPQRARAGGFRRHSLAVFLQHDRVHAALGGHIHQHGAENTRGLVGAGPDRYNGGSADMQALRDSKGIGCAGRSFAGNHLLLPGVGHISTVLNPALVHVGLSGVKAGDGQVAGEGALPLARVKAHRLPRAVPGVVGLPGQVHIALNPDAGLRLGPVVHAVQIVGVPAAQDAVQVQILKLGGGHMGPLVED